MVNYEMYRGDDKTISLSFKQGGSALDITNGSIFFTVKNTFDNDATDASSIYKTQIALGSGSGLIIPVSGLAVVTIPGSNSTGFSPGAYVFDFQYIDRSGTITTVCDGKFTVKSDVTRRVSGS